MALKDWKPNYEGAWSWHNIKNKKQLALSKAINRAKSKKIFYSVHIWSYTNPTHSHYRNFKTRSDALKFIKLYKKKH